MHFTLLHIAIAFFFGFFLGGIFGLGIHYIRLSSKPKQQSQTQPPPLKPDPERELLPDIPETLINKRSRSPELDYPSLAPLHLTPSYSETTFPESTPSAHSTEMDFEKTQDFQVRLDSGSLSDSHEKASVDISEEDSIEDVTQVMPRKK